MVSYPSSKSSKKDPQRVKTSDREFVKKLDCSGITFPVQIKDIKKKEKGNCINIKSVSMRKPGRTRTEVIQLKSPISLKLGTTVGFGG